MRNFPNFKVLSLLPVVLFVGCGGDMPQSWVLSPARASAEVKLPSQFFEEGPDFLQLTVQRVTNPDLIPFAVQAFCVCSDVALPIEITSFALFPPDNPGTFLIRSQEFLDRSDAQPDLLVRISPDLPAGLEPSDLEIEFRVGWDSLP